MWIDAGFPFSCNCNTVRDQPNHFHVLVIAFFSSSDFSLSVGIKLSCICNTQIHESVIAFFSSLYFSLSVGLPLLSSEQERVVLETMNQTLYTEMGFRGNNDNYYDENNSFINKVRIFFLCVCSTQFSQFKLFVCI